MKIHRLVDQLDARDEDGCSRAIFHQCFRIEVVEAVHPAEEEGAIIGLAIRVAVEFIALQAIAHREIAEALRASIVARDALVGAHPQPAFRICEHAVYHIVRQAIARGDALHLASARVEAVQATAIGTQPQHACWIIRVGTDGEDDVDGQRSWVARIVHVVTPIARGGIEAHQPFHRSGPDASVSAFVQCRGEMVGVADRWYGPWKGRERVAAYVALP